MQATFSAGYFLWMSTRLWNSLMHGAQAVLQASITTTLPWWLAISSWISSKERVLSNTSGWSTACAPTTGAGLGLAAGAVFGGQPVKQTDSATNRTTMEN